MKILVCPLDWGLGHATRCIPLIRALEKCGHAVSIAAGGGGLHLLRQEFPQRPCLEFTGYRVRYARSAWGFLPFLLWQAPAIALGLWRESRQLKRLVKEHGVEIVISDGRYGLLAKKVPTIFITHQIFLRVPGDFLGRSMLERLVRMLNLTWLKRFQEVWVPDFSGPENLSGALSHGALLANARFIGPLSRFQGKQEKPEDNAKRFEEGIVRIDVLAMVSGPEPQRTTFESRLREQMGKMKGTRVIVKGLPGADKTKGNPEGQFPGSEYRIAPGELNEFNHAPGAVLSEWMRAANWVVARSGYTTLMEMAGLGLKAVLLVPTPGQSEQEYLAQHLHDQGVAFTQKQSDLELTEASLKVTAMKGFGDGLPRQAERLFEFLIEHPMLRSRMPDKETHREKLPRQQF